MAGVKVILPLPPAILGANKRTGSRGANIAKDKAIAQYRLECAQIIAHDCKLRNIVASVAFRVYTANNPLWPKSQYYHPRDVTNAMHACKPAFDALIDAGVIKDDAFDYLQISSAVGYGPEECRQYGITRPGIVLEIEDANAQQ